MILGAQKPMKGTPINRAHWSCRGLQALYLFNEGSGALVHDYSGNSRPGTCVGSPMWVGNGLQLNGTSQYASAQATWAKNLSELTVLAVLRDLDPGALVYDTAFNLWYSGATGDDRFLAWLTRDGGSGKWRWLLGKRGNSCYSLAPTSSGVHALCGVMRASGQELYLDGAFQSTGAGTATIGNDVSTALIGSAYSTTYCGPFDMSLVAAWNRALPADAIRSLSSAPYQMFYGHEV